MNVKKAQGGAHEKRTITKLSSKTRSAPGREGAKAAARNRGDSTGTGSGAGAMTVQELRCEAARLDIDGPLEDGQGPAHARERVASWSARPCAGWTTARSPRSRWSAWARRSWR